MCGGAALDLFEAPELELLVCGNPVLDMMVGIYALRILVLCMCACVRACVYVRLCSILPLCERDARSSENTSRCTDILFAH